MQGSRIKGIGSRFPRLLLRMFPRQSPKAVTKAYAQGIVYKVKSQGVGLSMRFKRLMRWFQGGGLLVAQVSPHPITRNTQEVPKDKCKAESPRHFPRQRSEYEVSKDIIPKKGCMEYRGEVSRSVYLWRYFSYGCELKAVGQGKAQGNHERNKGTKVSNQVQKPRERIQ